MEKITVYELMAYLIPGYLLIYLGDKLFHPIHNIHIAATNDLTSNIVYFIASLVLGIFLHLLVDNMKEQIKNLFYKPVGNIIEDAKFPYPSIYEDLKSEYKTTSGIVPEITSEGYPKNLFDYAYHYLEVNNKISSVKNFQSLYYLMRNLFFIFCIYFIILLFTLCFSSDKSEWLQPFCLLGIGIIILLMCARFLRKKYVMKTLWNYYVDRKHISFDKNKI
jgi:hypothetical protein